MTTAAHAPDAPTADEALVLQLARRSPDSRRSARRGLSNDVVHARRRLAAADAFPGDPHRATAELTVAPAGKPPTPVALSAEQASAVLATLRPALAADLASAEDALAAFDAALATLSAETPTPPPTPGTASEPEPEPDDDGDGDDDRVSVG